MPEPTLDALVARIETWIASREAIDREREQIANEREKLANERDRRYEERFLASDRAVQTALASQEKAVGKAEAAQQAYNERSNEFRGQLDDQAKRLMPREEANLLIGTISEKLESERLNGAARWDEVKRDIAALREAQASGQGGRAQTLESRQQSQFTTAQLITIGLVVLGLVVTIAIAYIGAQSG